MQRNEVCLVMLAAAKGEALTPVQIQKSIFLAWKEFPEVVGQGTFSFVPYNYGPFDSKIYQDLGELKALGLIEIYRDEDGRWDVYRATPSGIEKGELTLASAPREFRSFVERVVAWVRRLTFDQLVASIYEKFPQYSQNSIFRRAR